MQQNAEKNWHNKTLPKTSWNFSLAHRRIIHGWGSKDYSHPLTQLFHTSSNESHTSSNEFYTSSKMPLLKVSDFVPSTETMGTWVSEEKMGWKSPFHETLRKEDSSRLWHSRRKEDTLLVEGNFINILGQPEVTPNYGCWMTVFLM